MALDMLGELRKLLGRAEADTGEADGIGEADVDVPDVDVPDVDNTAENDAREGDVVEDAPDAGTGDTNADEAAADDAEETMPDSEISVAELRDALAEAGAKIERLRAMVAELGGDPDDGDADAEETAEDVVDEVDDEYDDEAAQKDLDEQERQIAALARK